MAYIASHTVSFVTFCLHQFVIQRNVICSLISISLFFNIRIPFFVNLSFEFRNSTDFPKCLGIAFERLFVLCSDKCEDVRIFSEESLNRLTHVS